MSLRDELLENRELLSLKWARFYLASRVRARTPLGAVEYLSAKKERAPEIYRARVEIALNCLQIYRQLFPHEYARSSAPPFSFQREHEFYRLVHTSNLCFPLVVDPERDLLELLAEHPNLWLPAIPLVGLQRNSWNPGEFRFDEIEICFQLVLALCHCLEHRVGWQKLELAHGVKLPEPAPPLATVGWTQFKYSCEVDQSTPLCFLPLAFDLVHHETGNPWLDLPRHSMAPIPWDIHAMARLAVAWAQVKDFDLAIETLNQWLREKPQERLTRAIELWNRASKIEVASGYAGAQIPDLVDAGVAVPIDYGGRLYAHLHTPLMLSGGENDER